MATECTCACYIRSYLIHTVMCVQSTPRRWCESSETDHFGVLHSYNMNQVRQNMSRAINKNGYSTSWTTKVAVPSLIANQQEIVLLALFLYRVSCFKAKVCGCFSPIQPFSHFCLITWPLYSDHTTSDGGVLGIASAQLYSDTWLKFCLSRVKSVLQTGESSMT